MLFPSMLQDVILCLDGRQLQWQAPALRSHVCRLLSAVGGAGVALLLCTCLLASHAGICNPEALSLPPLSCQSCVKPFCLM